jgi:alpha-glucosidase
MTALFSPAPVKLSMKSDRCRDVIETADYIAKTKGTRSYPWRFFIITRNDGQLIGNTMVCRLSPQNILPDVSWVKPGLVAWDWLNRWADYGPEMTFKAGVNTAAYKHYIDFAARNNIRYLILDEGWSVDAAHPMQIIPEVNLPELVEYGNSKGVGLILWLTYAGVYDDFRDDSYNLFEHYAKMGVKGFKIDFMNRNDQEIVNDYEKMVAEAAKYKMLVELHGSYKPTGLEYRYPNLLSYESVLGMEQGGNCRPDNSLWQPFLRNVVGPMSFTPGGFLSVQPQFYRGLGPNPVFIGTRAQQMAYYVLFECGLQMISDSPRRFDENPDCRDFVFSVPVTWDETLSLAADAGQYLVAAKRHGDKWFVGGICNNAERVREMDVKLDFLPVGKTFRMVSFIDGPNAGVQAMDYNIVVRQVKKGDTVHVKMVRNGGLAAVLEDTSKPFILSEKQINSMQ